MIITIGGLAGSGTTTVSEILSEKMGMPRISAGDIFRKMASEMGMDILTFGKFAEENPEIDSEIDRKQSKIAKKRKNIIIEGRLSAYFVDAELKIWLMAPLNVRAKRISKREDKPFHIVKKEIKEREKSEAKRYLGIHDIDIRNMEIYDVIINTYHFNAEKVADIILKTAEVILCQQ